MHELKDWINSFNDEYCKVLIIDPDTETIFYKDRTLPCVARFLSYSWF